MKQVAPKRQRCAIYTRKSTEHNLDLAFNSLDAQREACEAYIKSQAHEGWTLVPAHFDDGGLSGASLDRPALQTLFDQVRLKKIDIVVVYKVDRLTRSLADFAKLVELFDEHDVSFVSVTQAFNTTSSMGRLTLNVLLSFAQFEREVIGERVRDKIAASKRKAVWVGGPVPLGCRSVDKKLQVVPDEADLVRKIFKNNLGLGSLSALAASLNAEALKPKPRQLTNGRTVAAACYRIGPLAHLLKNRFYIGEIVYRGEVHQGEHEPILERDVFESVQALLKEKTVERSTIRASSPSLLTGRIFDDRNNPLTPTHANKKGVRDRYYVSHALLQGQKAEIGSVARVAAPRAEPYPRVPRSGFAAIVTRAISGRRPRSSMASLVIRDNGQGFEPKSGNKRHGLGLVRRLAEQVRGTANVASGSGITTWTIDFPMGVTASSSSAYHLNDSNEPFDPNIDRKPQEKAAFY
jgi:DNA invertase Pin-like site-specific DNA recombinase